MRRKSSGRILALAAASALAAAWPASFAGSQSDQGSWRPHGPENEQSADPVDGTAQGPPKDPVAQCIRDKMNAERMLRGLPALPEIAPLLALAQAHSDAMASRAWMHHSSHPGSGNLPSGWRTYGENVVYGKSCDQMFEAFMLSDAHRDLMLRPEFNASAAAVSYGADGWIYTTLSFLEIPALPAPAPSPVSPAPAPSVAPPPPEASSVPPGAPPVPPPPPAVIEPSPLPTITLGEPPAIAQPGAGIRSAEPSGEAPGSPSSEVRKPPANAGAVVSSMPEEAGSYVYDLSKGTVEFVYRLDEDDEPPRHALAARTTSGPHPLRRGPAPRPSRMS